MATISLVGSYGRHPMKAKSLRVVILLAGILAAVIALGIASFAVPVATWRTGELPAPPLSIIAGGPVVAMSNRVWIDTDAACGYTQRTDPDDCFALMLLIRSRNLKLVGISTVYGNATIDITDRVTRELVAILATEGWDVPKVHLGSDRAGADAVLVAAAPAYAALQQALEDGPLTIIALGPLTNIAAALKDKPNLQRQVSRLVAVMGRRPGHLFHPSEGVSGGMLFGHGPIFRDFNFDQDQNSAKHVLAMNLPLTLIPYDVARKVTLTGADLDGLNANGGASAWVALRARGWLQFWKQEVGKGGFYPFDLLAAAYSLQPSLFSCAETKAWINPDARLWSWGHGRDALLVGLDGERPSDVKAADPVFYCPQIDPGSLTWISSRLRFQSKALQVSAMPIVTANREQ